MFNYVTYSVKRTTNSYTHSDHEPNELTITLPRFELKKLPSSRLTSRPWGLV